MEYSNTYLARFIDRPNRFVAHCQLLTTNEIVTVHVKNTGRTSILQPGVTTALVKSDRPNRKTLYDLVAAKKYDQIWINIDSQAPNVVVNEGLTQNDIHLPGIERITKVMPEVQFLDSRVDFMGFGTKSEPFFLEVKGVTLVNQGIAAFPDAPTTRGLKHVHTLEKAIDAGYRAYLFFVIQMADIHKVTINRAIYAPLAEAIAQAQAKGVQVLAYDCAVTPQTLTLKRPVPFDLDQPFVSDGLPSSITPKVKKPLE
ncbi:DNA/RNA nuclease SfsA [Agrilactobacillus yilanensis]|uniref:Sugar fermentation stimulation protein homolog n=1 Tax=Agrilactobacillus yilanensis TaxID=2485997 RepID=A0ABW4J3V1_9LACO|nr:DNA/RNA nuclease SfsA [Agrilactobacillus yilanensis]